jgi:hypothetical protein
VSQDRCAAAAQSFSCFLHLLRLNCLSFLSPAEGTAETRKNKGHGHIKVLGRETVEAESLALGVWELASAGIVLKYEPVRNVELGRFRSSVLLQRQAAHTAYPCALSLRFCPINHSLK